MQVEKLEFSQNLQSTIEFTEILATKFGHDVVTLEHLLLALTNDLDARDLFKAFGVNTEFIERDIDGFFNLIFNNRVSKQLDQLSKTDSYRNFLIRIQIDRQYPNQNLITGANAIAALLREHDSRANNILSSYGLHFEGAADFAARKEFESKETENTKNLEKADALKENQTKETVNPEDILPRVWLCQYKPTDSVRSFTKETETGKTIWWKVGNNNQGGAMEEGDPILYWRSVKDKNDRGGIVGVGYVVSTEAKRKRGRDLHFKTRVLDFFEDAPLPRDDVIKFAGITRKNWQGSVLKLPSAEAVKVNDLLVQRNKAPIIWDKIVPPKDKEDQISFHRDDAETDHDSLSRAPLALSFAWKLHDVWCTEQGLKPFPERTPTIDGTSFVAHIDAPWGGGKTTFANMIASVLSLNPQAQAGTTKKTGPKFLHERYPDRDDLSGLFISAAHETNNLKTLDGENKWHEKARQPWIVVPFNAWLHQHVEPPWWCFYQNIRKACFKAIKKEGTPHVIQKSDGTYETQSTNFVERRLTHAQLWAKEIWWRLTNGKVLFQLSVTLISLIIGTILWKVGALEAVKNKAGLNTSLSIGLIVSFLTGTGAFITAGTTIIADALAPGRTMLGERVKLGSGDPLARFRKHFAGLMDSIERPVLVIIDDIDRCQPEFIVELTRGLQTILRSPRVVYLVLGDRQWIEKAFEVCNADMNEIDIGSEYRFGGRFAEKAIQMSYILPSMDNSQDDYVREILLGKTTSLPANEISEEKFREEARKDLSENQNNEDIEESGEDLEAQVHDRADLKRIVREEVILRRATKRDEVEQAIRHHLQPVAKYLPNNPRHIKRTINAISMYQDSLVLTEQSFENTEIGGQRWRELVIGIVLMMGYPKSWSILTDNPKLSEMLELTDNQISKLDDDVAANLEQLKSKSEVPELIKGINFAVNDTAPAIKVPLTPDTIEWLKLIIPSRF
ncbi:P-loop NTPase fold protein [Terasakiella sp. A23]|uniref:P-loop NTPase fold protein n=1 Tax=Terasakiella sp. FCG-A23 TaxID=3080561 RepID=UPI002954F897|nr:P-loop NTPase fold protein [Terasakiella sp. A23]MDV7340226.1 P-loop NTPase fold protein [Terasakiella sp. A23]